MSSPNTTPPSTSKLSLSTLLNATPLTALTFDGGLATHLTTLGAELHPRLWSASCLLTHPSLIHATHLAYYRSGANIATTASYQASPRGLTQYLNLLDSEAHAVVKKSVTLAQEAQKEYLKSLDGQARRGREGKLLVAGSVGPYGAFLADGSEYRGDYTLEKDALEIFHRPRIAALVEAGVDVLACETIPSLRETEALAELLHREFPQTEAWFSFTLRDAEHISDGTLLSRVLEVLDGCENVVAVGVNCVSEEVALDAIRHSVKLTQKPLVVYPNSGEQWDAKERVWHGARTEGVQLAERTRQFWEAGARGIGGCCRTTPDDIRVIAETLHTI
ncbi:homocysteine S-methyltransferase [Massariosphaeria phaeospora]|uniref:Homocysteine S-methyltransferase n=1 Tax=Massariosphaeria phaeospora TaxID=100035 RepID=A0A7C8IE73_9PLEO|nr:homocysteine S-methyltransferase [Massariosphaeria phaeospora]